MVTHRSASVFDPMRKLKETKTGELREAFRIYLGLLKCVLQFCAYGGCMSFRSVLSSSAFGSLAQ